MIIGTMGSYRNTDYVTGLDIGTSKIAVVIGGDTRNGKIEDGRYYLEYKGKFTEVSPETYHYSKVHGIVTLATIPLAIICMVFIVFLKRHSPAIVFKPDNNIGRRHSYFLELFSKEKYIYLADSSGLFQTLERIIIQKPSIVKLQDRILVREAIGRLL